MSADFHDENDVILSPPCPTCGRAGVQAYRPFCSKRCADVDLQRWFTGRYAIPVGEDEDEDGPDDPPRR